MAAHRKRPMPTTRIVQLLVERKRELLDGGVELTRANFEQAWSESWEVMVAEKAWPHATEHRRQWRAAMIVCKSESRAAWLGVDTPFSEVADALVAAGRRLEVEMSADDLPRAFLEAIRMVGATLPEEAPGGAGEGVEAMRA